MAATVPRRIVGVMVFRRRPPPGPLAAVDPGALPPALRAPVADAQRAQAQFAGLVTGLPDGPLRTRLGELGERVDAGVLAIWRTASQAAAIERVTASLDPERVTAELKEARRRGADPSVIDALQERFASVQRLLNARDEMSQKLPVLEARLATAVARTAELTLAAPQVADRELARVSDEFDALVGELDALHAATAELA
jgi:hypothetical protein